MRTLTPASLKLETFTRCYVYDIMHIKYVSNIQQTTLRAIIFQQIRAIYIINLPSDEEFHILIQGSGLNYTRILFYQNSTRIYTRN